MIMVDFKQQLHDESRVVMQIPPKYNRHINRDWLIPLKIFEPNDIGDEEPSFVMTDTSCIDDEGQDDEEAVYSNMDGDDFIELVDLKHMRFLRAAEIERYRIMRLHEADVDIYFEYYATGGTNITVLKDGLCVWFEKEGHPEECQFELVCPMHIIRQIVLDCEKLVRQELIDLENNNANTLKQKLIMRYEIDKPELLQQNTLGLWSSIAHNAKRSNLEVETVQIVSDGTEILLILKRLEPAWHSMRFCMASMCDYSVMDFSSVDCDPTDMTAVKRKAYCQRHQNEHPITLDVLKDYRGRKFKIEYRNYTNRHFEYAGCCDMPHELEACGVNAQGEMVLGCLYLRRTYLAFRNIDEAGSIVGPDVQLPLARIVRIHR